MPLPTGPFTISGGCNCQAIRWHVEAPTHSERMKCPYKDPGTDIGDLRLPMLAFDHCNDCRRATGAYLPAWIAADTNSVSFSLLPKPETAIEFRDEHLKLRNDGPYLPASQVLNRSSDIAQASYLVFFNSSAKRTRSFCSRCGTPVSYQVDNEVLEEYGMQPMVDLPLGTADRADLEREWMIPERRLWCENGLPWLRQFVARGAPDMPAHPTSRINVTVEPGT